MEENIEIFIVDFENLDKYELIGTKGYFEKRYSEEFEMFFIYSTEKEKIKVEIAEGEFVEYEVLKDYSYISFTKEMEELNEGDFWSGIEE